MEEERRRFGRVRTHGPFGQQPADRPLVVRLRVAYATTVPPSKQRSRRRHISGCEMREMMNEDVGLSDGGFVDARGASMKEDRC